MTIPLRGVGLTILIPRIVNSFQAFSYHNGKAIGSDKLRNYYYYEALTVLQHMKMLKLRYETLQTQSHSRTTPSYVLECYKAAFGAVSGAPLPATRAGGYLYNLDVLQNYQHPEL